MKDLTETEDIRADVQRRLKRAIIGLTKMTTGPRRELLFTCLDLVSPPLAYNGVGESRIPGPAGVETPRKDDVWLCVLSEVGRAIRAFYSLTRTDEAPGLTRLLHNLEGYAKYGLDSVEVLGSTGTGFYLFNKAAQDAAVAERDRVLPPKSKAPPKPSPAGHAKARR